MLNSGYWQIAQHFGAISKYLIKIQYVKVQHLSYTI